MLWWKKTLVVVPVVAAMTVWGPEPVEACGGCFVPDGSSTQVTGHQMILSMGMDQTTLWDQFSYADGDGSDFTWVLPTKGVVEIGLSSDLIFGQLGVDTAVTVLPPPQSCPPTNCDDGDFAAESDANFGGGGGSADDGVTVLAQEQVGPYETVQLQSSDPAALNDWLETNGYTIPDDVQPIINSYVAEQFNFLALKLSPGVGVDRMQPVRVTTPGAGVALPLRMVAAGTGVTTAVTLWVIGEGRYEPSNFPGFGISEDALVWDYDTWSSNYTTLRAAAYDASNGHAWLTEASRPYSPQLFRSTISNIVQSVDPSQSGYDDGSGDWDAAYEAAQQDMDVLFGSLDEDSVTVTRLRAELSREALGDDLVVQASSDQSQVSSTLQATKWVGTQPPCPEVCDDSFGNPGGDDDIIGSGSGNGCTLSVDDDSDTGMAAAVVMMALGLALRRRRKRS